MRQIEELPVGMHVAEIIVMFEESVLGVHHLHPGQRFLVGESAAAELCWPLAGALESPVRVSPSGAIELCASPGLAASIELYDSQPSAGALSFARELDTGADVATLPEHARARIVFGEVSLLVGRTEAPRRRSLPPPIDLRAHVTTVVVGVVFLLSLLAMNAIPPSGNSLLIDPFALDGRIAHLELVPPLLPQKSGAGAAGPAHASTPVGGRPRPHFTTSAFATPRATARSAKSVTERRAAAEETAAQSGILGVLQAADGTHLASIFGPGSALGEAGATMATLNGSFAPGEGGVGNGVGTLAGSGHGGTGEGTISLGGLGRIGRASGNGNGYGIAGGTGGLRGRHAGTPDFVPGVAEVRGSIDKDIIRRVVRQHIQEVKFCYEKELLKKPTLDGRVVTSFVIAGNGTVAAASVKESTIKDPEVDGCIATAIRRWAFPKPPGGPVFVTYPFAFHAASHAAAEGSVDGSTEVL